ncbi:unnamed protein product [Calypogeia fissa]
MEVASAKESGRGGGLWQGTEMAFGEWCSGNESLEWGSGGGNSGATVMWEAWERILERARGQSGEARQWRKGYNGEAMEVWRWGKEKAAEIRSFGIEKMSSTKRMDGEKLVNGQELRR